MAPGVVEFQAEAAALKSSKESGLLDDEDFRQMMVDNQRRNLSSASVDGQPLSRLAMERLLWPVCVTLGVLAFVLLSMVGLLYETMSYKILHSRNDTTFALSTVVEEDLQGHGVTVKSGAASGGAVSARPLYYLSPPEGVLSHILQLRQLWAVTHALNRTLAPVSFHSASHFPDVEWVNMCDIFDLPRDVVCSCSHNGAPSPCTPPVVTKAVKCALIGVTPWALDARMYSLPHGQHVEPSFDFSRGDCVAGHMDAKSVAPSVLSSSSSSSTSASSSFSSSSSPSSSSAASAKDDASSTAVAASQLFVIKFNERYEKLIRTATYRLSALHVQKSRRWRRRRRTDEKEDGEDKEDKEEEAEEEDKEGEEKDEDEDEKDGEDEDKDEDEKDADDRNKGTSSEAPSSGTLRPFTTVHWSNEEMARRGDCAAAASSSGTLSTRGNNDGNRHRRRKLNVEKGKEKLSHGVNCVSHTDFIAMVRKQLGKDIVDELVFVVTTEKNATILADIRAAGLKLFSDLRMSETLSSLDVSVVELGLVVASTQQLLFSPSSSYANFISIIRSQKYKQF